jgi:hypothetical protein
VKILFVMHYPGYLRYYDSTVLMLAERGHDVYLGFESPHKQPEGLEAVEGVERVHVLEQLPKRGDPWDSVARGLRSTIDYARYLHPRLAEARYLRGRMEKVLPPPLRLLSRIHRLSPAQVKILFRLYQALEAGIPSSPVIEDYIEQVAPDVVLVSPLVTDGSRQTDVIKSARALGLPTALGVASWDHLTTKGLIRLEPDRILVWNAIQREEAESLHYSNPDRILITGAQPFDRWFVREPSLTRAEFCRRVGLPSDAPFLLFVGSTASISEPEAEQRFVLRWIEAIRLSSDSAIADAPILVRPHPFNPGDWGQVDLSSYGATAVWPRSEANPVNEGDRDDYFHSLVYSVAVVGINTSAMIEAAILERPVHTLHVPEFAETQELTLHFNYLLPEHGGFLRVARSLDEHVMQIGETLAEPGVAEDVLRSFVGSFVRPFGLDRPATPIVVEAIEQLGRGLRPQPVVPGRLARAGRPLLFGLGFLMALDEPKQAIRFVNHTTAVLTESLRSKAAELERYPRAQEALELTATWAERASLLIRRRLKTGAPIFPPLLKALRPRLGSAVDGSRADAPSTAERLPTPPS